MFDKKTSRIAVFYYSIVLASFCLFSFCEAKADKYIDFKVQMQDIIYVQFSSLKPSFQLRASFLQIIPKKIWFFETSLGYELKAENVSVNFNIHHENKTNKSSKKKFRAFDSFQKIFPYNIIAIKLYQISLNFNYDNNSTLTITSHKAKIIDRSLIYLYDNVTISKADMRLHTQSLFLDLTKKMFWTDKRYKLLKKKQTIYGNKGVWDIFFRPISL